MTVGTPTRSLADQEPGTYTWWPDGDDAGGLRTDTQIISELLVNHVQRGYVYEEQAFPTTRRL